MTAVDTNHLFSVSKEMKMYMGDDEGDAGEKDESSPGGIAIETLSNIRTVASLTLEEDRISEYEEALRAEDPHPIRTNMVKGSAAGLGQFAQMWSMALLFWSGGRLLETGEFSYRAFLISMFALMFSLYGLSLAAQGAVNREKAKLAAARIFELVDRQSLIDPIPEEQEKKEV